MYNSDGLYITWKIIREDKFSVPYFSFFIGKNQFKGVVIKIPIWYSIKELRSMNIFEAWKIAQVEYNKFKWGFWQSSKVYQ